MSKVIFTTRKRSLGQGNFFTAVCHSVHRGGVRGCWGAFIVAGGCMVARGACVVMGACIVAGGRHAWLLGGWGHAWLPGVGGMHVCWGVCMVAGGACMVPGGACVVAGGHAWLRGGVHGCRGGMHRIRRDTVNELAVRILLECILVFFSFAGDHL